MKEKDLNIIFKGIVGSQAYGLSTETSDVDIKGVYLQSNVDILSNNYIPQIDIDKDTVFYELRRFLELVSVGNPNVLELLFLPKHCVLHKTNLWEEIYNVRNSFLTKKCYNTYSGYAKTQLNKAKGINKKFNWEENRINRKTIQDFSKIVDRQSGKIYLLKDWLKEENIAAEQLGLSAISGFRDCYKVYVDYIKWANDNHRFETPYEERNYKGFGGKDSNQPKLSSIEKYRSNDWKGIVYFNREEYSKHCKEYREYKKWLNNRNEHRVATNKKHGQQFDSKNILHLVRLIMTAEEIPTLKTINVDRSKDREYLLSIKNGELDLKNIIKKWGERAEELKNLYENSDLPKEVDVEFIKQLELKIRSYEL